MEINTSYQKVEGHSGCYRDPSTGAILNTNVEAIAKARAVKKARVEKEQELEAVKLDVVNIRADITDIKLLLQKLADK
jgi:hypothetical protein|tara:strand:+ start:25291 stop:25524 length:234 start_codon:yes stop_codon:yes gene_type:complete